MIWCWDRVAAVGVRAVLRVCLLAWVIAEPAVGQRAEGRYAYKEFDGIYVVYRPGEFATYRELLPKVFDMPDVPLVQIFFADYYKMDEATQPYLEAAVSLQAKYEGKKIWHCITMPVTSDEARRLGVAFLGFPKVMGDISLDRGDPDYTGTLKLDGALVMRITLHTKGHVVTPEEEQWFRDLTGIPSLNLLNGKVLDPMGGRRRTRVSLLEMSRTYPQSLEVKVGKAELTLSPEAAKGQSEKPLAAFAIKPAEIVLAYYMKNKFGFRFGRPPVQGGG